MKRIAVIAVLVVALALLVTVGGAVYVVYEMQQVIITQFGEPKGEAVTEAGLHLKIPFIQKTNYFSKLFLEWDGDPNQVPTKDKRFVYEDGKQM